MRYNMIGIIVSFLFFPFLLSSPLLFLSFFSVWKLTRDDRFTDAYTENYGPLGILDDVYGSNKVFRAWLGELEERDGMSDVLKVAREELADKEGRGEVLKPQEGEKQD